jgi:predicted MPP superfamily phosphohydrolase
MASRSRTSRICTSGRFTNGQVLEDIIAATNQLQSDLVLLTGDLINHDLRDLPNALRLVNALEARHGVFMCEGNHDLIEDGPTFVAETRAAGVRLLVNESASIDVRGRAVQLLGLRWGAGERNATRSQHNSELAIGGSVEALLGQLDPAAFPIMLAHHPHAFDFAAGVPLTLAGHTHGGQLMLNEQQGFGPLMFRYWSGLYEKYERKLVVSNGVGNWFPLRTRAPAEIIHLTLRTA